MVAIVPHPHSFSDPGSVLLERVVRLPGKRLGIRPAKLLNCGSRSAGNAAGPVCAGKGKLRPIAVIEGQRNRPVDTVKSANGLLSPGFISMLEIDKPFSHRVKVHNRGLAVVGNGDGDEVAGRAKGEPDILRFPGCAIPIDAFHASVKVGNVRQALGIQRQRCRAFSVRDICKLPIGAGAMGIFEDLLRGIAVADMGAVAPIECQRRIPAHVAGAVDNCDDPSAC